MDLSLLGKILELHQSGNLNEAEKLYKDFIANNPGDETALYNYGLFCYDTGRINEAINYILEAIQINPSPDFLVALAEIYDKNNHKQQAIKVYQELLKLEPANIDFLFDLGSLYYDESLFSEALQVFEKIITRVPDDFEVNYIMGISLYNLKQFDIAAEYIQKSVKLNPLRSEVWKNLGIVYYEMYSDKQAIECYIKSIELGENNASIYRCLAAAYSRSGEMSAAVEYYRKAFELDPDDLDIKYNYGRALLANKEFNEGWIHSDDARIMLFKHHNLRFPTSVKPKWNGESLKNKTIYAYTSAGIGDDIFYVRYLPELHAKGARVIARPRNEIAALLRENDLKAEIIDNSISDESLEFDYQIPIVSLPRAFNTNLDNIPYTSGYLKANPEKVKYYKDTFFQNDDFKLGICWSGSGEYAGRNVDLSHFLCFAEFPGVKIYSLQKGEAEKDILEIPNNVEIIDLGKTFSDFSDTAAAIENLDLIITIDTSVLHIAGALGKKTWALIPYYTGWNWLLKGEECVWYDSVSLFRQQEPNNWNEIISKVHLKFKNIISIS